jgi:acetylornithine deacetylase/succinyl-diaminopimelate desuccinylase-like protein
MPAVPDAAMRTMILTLLLATASPALAQSAPIKAAHARIAADYDQTIAEVIELTEIPAPPFKEAARGQRMLEKFKALGLSDVHMDAVGNVIGIRPGKDRAAKALMVAAHLDTVFPPDVAIKVRREGDTLHAPGIGDTTVTLAALLAFVRAMDAGKIQTTRDIIFVANVGEEGQGDLRGVRHIFSASPLKPRIGDFISFDGSNVARIVNGGVGSRRYRVAFKGPGGHSYGAFGLVNPTHALGRAVGKIADLQVPTDPKTTFNVGRIGGGTSVNSIAFESWMEIDMRSHDVASLNVIRDQIIAAIHDSVKAENARWKRGEVTVDIDLVGDRPAGSTDPESPIVKTAQASVRALGGLPTLSTGSTDSNYPIRLGVPAVTVGRGGIGRNNHSLDESFDTTDAWKGPQNVILLITSLAR